MLKIETWTQILWPDLRHPLLNSLLISIMRFISLKYA